jgi:hypothetical protein
MSTKTVEKVIACAFTSEWSDGSTVTTQCVYNPDTGEVTPEVSQGPVPTGTLDEEYITLPDGTLINICMVCHSFVLKPAMNPGIGHTLYEAEECRNPDCSDEE